MKARLLIKEFLDNPRYSLSVEEAIFKEVIGGNSPPTLWLWRHDRAAVVGRFQVPSEEIDMELAERLGIKIAKRSTGGGAIYQDLGNVIYSVITPDIYGIGNRVTELYRRIITPFIEALNSMYNVGAGVEGLNDGVVNGRKFMGTAATISEGTILFHATILVKSDLGVLSRILKVPRVKLADKHVESVEHRVANLYDVARVGITEVQAAIVEAYRRSLGFELELAGLTERERSLADELYRSKYNTDAWVYQRGI